MEYRRTKLENALSYMRLASHGIYFRKWQVHMFQVSSRVSWQLVNDDDLSYRKITLATSEQVKRKVVNLPQHLSLNLTGIPLSAMKGLCGSLHATRNQSNTR